MDDVVLCDRLCWTGQFGWRIGHHFYGLSPDSGLKGEFLNFKRSFDVLGYEWLRAFPFLFSNADIDIQRTLPNSQANAVEPHYQILPNLILLVLIEYLFEVVPQSSELLVPAGLLRLFDEAAGELPDVIQLQHVGVLEVFQLVEGVLDEEEDLPEDVLQSPAKPVEYCGEALPSMAQLQKVLLVVEHRHDLSSLQPLNTCRDLRVLLIGHLRVVWRWQLFGRPSSFTCLHC